MSGVPLGISSLPHELISEIFLLCLPEIPSFSKDTAPLLFTQVCRRWRQISLSTPRLWSSIRVPRWEHRPADPAQLLHLWIQRSQECSLNIHFDIVDEVVQEIPFAGDDVGFQELITNLMAVISPHLGRIRRFAGVLPEYMIDRIGFEEMKILEELTYYGMLIFTEPISEPSLQLAKVSTPLKKLSLSGLVVNIDNIALQVQLTCLELTDMCQNFADGQLTPGRMLNLFKSLPLLETCAVDLALLDREPLSILEDKLNLTSLRQLHLSWTSPAEIGTLLDCISAPNLRRLGLRGTPRTYTGTWSNLKQFLARSRAPLTHLSLGDMADVDVEMLECFQYCPELTNLTVNHGPLDCDVLSGLESRPLLPKLEALSIGACNEFDADDLISMLESRRRKDLPPGRGYLREIKVMYCVGVWEDWRESIMACGTKNVVIDSGGSFRMPFGMGVLPIVRVVEPHRDFFAVCSFHRVGDSER